jgi:hypothetical protein
MVSKEGLEEDAEDPGQDPFYSAAAPPFIEAPTLLPKEIFFFVEWRR